MTPDQEAGICSVYAELQHALALLNRANAVLRGCDEIVYALQLPVHAPLTSNNLPYRVDVLSQYGRIADHIAHIRRRFPHLVVTVPEQAAA